MKEKHEDCTSHSCDWTIFENSNRNNEPELTCVHGSGNCLPLHLTELLVSEFHDEPLIKLSQEINQMVKQLTPHPQGHKVSLLIIGNKLILAWVNHGLEVPAGKKNVVTSKDSPEVIARALGLKD